MNRTNSWDSIPYKPKCFFDHWFHQNAHYISAVEVQVVSFLLHDIFTTEIYHPCFTSASGEKHTIVI